MLINNPSCLTESAFSFDLGLQGKYNRVHLPCKDLNVKVFVKYHMLHLP